MAKIGIIKGVNESASDYYFQRINELADVALTDDDKASFVFTSVDLDAFTPKGLDRYWNSLAGWFMSAAFELTNSSDTDCNYVAVTTNFLHKFNMYGEMMLTRELGNHKKAPCFIDMNDCIAEKLESLFAKRVLYLGPSYIMGDRDLAEQFRKTYDIEIMSLAGYEEEAFEIDRMIREDLSDYLALGECREYLLDFIDRFVSDGAVQPDAIVLGCYELTLIADQEDMPENIPLVDGVELHIQKIVELA